MLQRYPFLLPLICFVLVWIPSRLLGLNLQPFQYEAGIILALSGLCFLISDALRWPILGFAFLVTMGLGFALYRCPPPVKENPSTSIQYFQEYQGDFIVDAVWKPSSKYQRYLLKTKHKNESIGLLLHIPKQFRGGELGDTLKAQIQVLPLPKPGNPGDFDYHSYLNERGVQGMVYLRDAGLMEWKQGRESFSKWVERLQDLVKNHLEINLGTKEGRALGLALFSGDKTGFDPRAKANFGRAGAMHILAVSGMHVGILYLLSTFVFRFVKPFWRNLITVTLIWVFAGVTGFGSAVCRAALMFSFMTLGGMMHRNSGGLYGMLTSGVIILSIDPKLLFNLGFQFSYLAVWAILWVFPKLEGLWQPKNPVFKWTWSLITLSLIAQLATAPLAVFHFHQFPNYFLLTNLLMMPLVALWMYVGFPLLILSLCFPWFNGLWRILDFGAEWILGLADWISNLPFAVSEGLYVSEPCVWAVYLILFTLAVRAVERIKVLTWVGALASLVWIGISIHHEWHLNQRRDLIKLTTFTTENMLVVNGRTAEFIGYDAPNEFTSSFDFLRLKSVQPCPEGTQRPGLCWDGEVLEVEGKVWRYGNGRFNPVQ